jgi:hypothetical protein
MKLLEQFMFLFNEWFRICMEQHQLFEQNLLDVKECHLIA